MYIDVVTASELKRWLQAQGCSFKPGKGSHFRVTLAGKSATFPYHGKKEVPVGTVNSIKKQLGLK